MNIKVIYIAIILFVGIVNSIYSQHSVLGKVVSDVDGQPLIGASILILDTDIGTVTDWEGRFSLSHEMDTPFLLKVSYVGFHSDTVKYTGNGTVLTILLSEQTVNLESVVIQGERISEKMKASPLTVETMDALSVKEVPTDNFYDGLGNLKGVDLTAASLGFKVINTRGFNSTSPVRSLQLIDGVDNQAPGLNFSLGNFLGSSELDILKVDLIAGASSAFYGPNAFNGVISMTTKDPFYHTGVSAYMKMGERNLFEVATRWGQIVENKNGEGWLAYKLNFSYLKANDWEADNFDPVYGTETGIDNPGGFDAVNIYGDEYYAGNDLSAAPPWRFVGMGIWHRTGYKEVDLVDYNTKNLKANAAFHFRLDPTKEYDSPELILASSLGSGTTVYQGDNRFSLRNILFVQNRIEFRKKDRFFLRGYMTMDDAGDSYDPYFTALLLQEKAKTNEQWSGDYTAYYRRNYENKPFDLGYPDLDIRFEDGMVVQSFDYELAEQWLRDNNDLLTKWHNRTEEEANKAGISTSTEDYLVPGTDRFIEAFNEIVSGKSNSVEGGTRFFDRSALYHLHGEYVIQPGFAKEWVLGANARLYTPNSDGTIFYDTAGVRITNFEFGIYSGLEKSWGNRDRWTGNVTFRADKNENFDWLFSPAASVVYRFKQNSFLRFSFSSAIRNPTLTDQYLNLNVGRAVLSGNLEGVNDLINVESFTEYLNSLNNDDLNYFSIDPIRPEQVQTLESGIRTTLWKAVYFDANYYYSFYSDFIGYQIGLRGEFDRTTGLPQNIQAYRYSANSKNQVTTQGASIGINYFVNNRIGFRGNYSWNRLNKEFEDDPIIPAYNTPEHKFNLGISGRNLPFPFLKRKKYKFGFNLNYKWIEGFLFEGSPQFTGYIPTYDLLDLQLNWKLTGLHTTIKLGASNILNNKSFQTYGGPRIGRMGYITLLYEK